MQLIKVGAHLGHSFFYSSFFSSWMLHGWSYNMFVFDTLLSVYLFKIGLSYMANCVKMSRPIWFINLNLYMSPFVSSYAYLSGESFSVYSWINGALTNFRSIVGWGTLLYDLAAQGIYDFSHSDSKSLSGLIGFLFNSKSLPGTLFLPSVKDCEMAADEFSSANMPTVGVVDSNVLSWTVTVPMPGNDDSFKCMNFYSYLVSKTMISNKLQFIHYRWRAKMMKEASEKWSVKVVKKNLYYSYWVNKYIMNVSNVEDNLKAIMDLLKNENMVIKRSYTHYESLFKSFVKSDMVFKWKGF